MSKKRRKSQKSPREVPGSRTARLGKAQRLFEQERWEEAARELDRFTRRYPDNVEAWTLLAEVYAGMDNLARLWEVATERLVVLQPDVPQHWINATYVCVANNLPFSARHHVNHFLDTWPDHDQVSEMRELQTKIEMHCADVIAEYEIDPAQKPEDLMLFEQAQMLLSAGNHKRARQVSEEATRRLPGVAAPLNNLSLACAMEGQFDQAADLARQVLERFPDNIHALSNLTHFLVRVGRRDEARQVAGVLRQQVPDDGVKWLKQIEAFAYLGDDPTVVELYQQLEAAGFPPDTPRAMACHLAAVAFARQGDEKRARDLWKAALRDDRSFSPARGNLDDLKLPPGERHGAWPYSFAHWIPQEWVEELLDLTRGTRSEVSTKRKVQQLLEDRPDIKAIIPILLERGDPPGRQFALILAKQADLLDELHTFALSANGPDQSRLDAGQYLVEAGILPRGKPILLYARGEQQEILLLSYEITPEAQRSGVSPRVLRLHRQVHDALTGGHYEEGERLARAALETELDDPTLLNNLALALTELGRGDEAEEIIYYMAERHPDYLFARCAMAQLCTQEGKLDEARDWLDPLLERPRFHYSEFSALCAAHVTLLMAEGLPDGARAWLSFWEQIDPHHPDIKRLRRKVGKK
jgi:tetratricopeptide (TPR) repeat protein